jgi:hypothetical protein
MACRPLAASAISKPQRVRCADAHLAGIVVVLDKEDAGLCWVLFMGESLSRCAESIGCRPFEA